MVESFIKDEKIIDKFASILLAINVRSSTVRFSVLE